MDVCRHVSRNKKGKSYVNVVFVIILIIKGKVLCKLQLFEEIKKCRGKNISVTIKKIFFLFFSWRRNLISRKPVLVVNNMTRRVTYRDESQKIRWEDSKLNPIRHLSRWMQVHQHSRPQGYQHQWTHFFHLFLTFFFIFVFSVISCSSESSSETGWFWCTRRVCLSARRVTDRNLQSRRVLAAADTILCSQRSEVGRYRRCWNLKH